MNKKMISIVSICLIIILVVFLVSCTDKEPDANKDPRTDKDVITRPKEGISVSMPQEDIEFTRKCGKEWRSFDSLITGPPAKDVQKVGKLLKQYKPSRADVLSLLGEPAIEEPNPGSQHLTYTLSDSDAFNVYFDEHGKVIQVHGPGFEFISHYDFFWPFIRVGMTKDAVRSKLNAPGKILDDGKIWHYFDSRSKDPYLYIVTFDENDKVIKLEKTELK